MSQRDPLPSPTPRAYTLRLSTPDADNGAWRERLWKTHEVVNSGAEAFGDWLLSLRGGLDHRLVAVKVRVGRGASKTEREPTEDERRERRIVLALCWLSVESKKGAPQGRVVEDPVDALKRILGQRGLSEADAEQWVFDCRDSLSATIRDDATWVDRSAAFDETVQRLGSSLTREHAEQVIIEFFGDIHDYLALPKNMEEDGVTSPRGGSGKEFRTQARSWLSENWGAGQKGDKAQIVDALRKCSRCIAQEKPSTGSDLLRVLVRSLGGSPEETLRFDELRKLVGWRTGRRSTGAFALQRTVDMDRLSESDLESLEAKLTVEIDAKSPEASRSVPQWVESMRTAVEREVGMPFRSTRDLIGEFGVMLDHAARRVSATHSWIKRAEAERRKFEGDAAKLAQIPEEARQWLDQFCEDRSQELNALEPYRIRRRAVEGWESVVRTWAKADCKAEGDRVKAVRALQPEIEKFGDAALFEALAAEDALCVWLLDGKATPRPLLDYSAATDAQYRKRRFKVPAYRHPDALLHPVFCDFGESRWTIEFSAHRALGRRRKAQQLVDNKTVALQKAQERLRKAKAESSRSRAEEKVRAAEHALEAARKKLAFLQYRRALAVCLWTGKGVESTSLRWHSKRFAKDFAIGSSPEDGASTGVPVARADRLGRASANVPRGASVTISGVFEQKEWNGRLQAPRDALNAIAKVRDDETLPAADRSRRVQQMLSRLPWFVTFSARLVPQGPWLDYASEHSALGLRVDPKYWPHAEENRQRKGMARLILSRLPSLRVLSVDLGHRYAAACAVWETLSAQEMQRICREMGSAPPSPDDLYLHLRRADGNGKQRTTVYRRIGPDTLPDGGQHPAPWARLDRQFLIKLQGEDESARKASDSEIAVVKKFEADLGRPAMQRRSLRVDDLMSAAVRTARLALRRHGDRARIAFNLIADRRFRPGGAEEPLTDETRVDLLADTLATWHGLFSGGQCHDERAEEQWNEHIAPLLASSGASLSVPSDGDAVAATPARRRRKEVRGKLVPAAMELARRDLSQLSVLWVARWHQDDESWRARLRWLRDWILPRGAKADSGAIRHVGGLSVTRLATIRSLWQLQKAYRTQPEPEDPRKNVPKKGDTSLDDFGRTILDDLEHLRENRVKQLASRICEAALGVGVEQPNGGAKDPKRPQERRFSPCQAVVIENLTRYRPEETRTRRENRQLLNWSAGKVKQYLSEACELHGLHLREVSAAYTSRQDSRTGAPGIRCQDIPVVDFVRENGPCWGRLRSAQQSSGGTAEDQLLLALYERWSEKERTWRDQSGNVWAMDGEGRWVARNGTQLPQGSGLTPHPIRVPQRGGDIFVSAAPRSPAANGIQADLNAAANIGLWALLDPDWEGRWWRLPCSAMDLKPVKGSVNGSAVIHLDAPLKAAATKGAAKKDVVNLWRDISVRSLTEGVWRGYDAYWNLARYRVVQTLRPQVGIGSDE